MHGTQNMEVPGPNAPRGVLARVVGKGVLARVVENIAKEGMYIIYHDGSLLSCISIQILLIDER